MFNRTYQRSESTQQWQTWKRNRQRNRQILYPVRYDMRALSERRSGERRPLCAAADVAPMIRPPRPCLIICIPAYLQQRKTLRVLTAKTPSQLSRRTEVERRRDVQHWSKGSHGRAHCRRCSCENIHPHLQPSTVSRIRIFHVTEQSFKEL